MGIRPARARFACLQKHKLGGVVPQYVAEPGEVRSKDKKQPRSAEAKMRAKMRVFVFQCHSEK